MTEREKLKRKIKYEFGTLKECASYLGISCVALNKKLKGDYRFNKGEQVLLKKMRVKVPEEFVKQNKGV